MATYRPGANGSMVRRRSRITRFLSRFDAETPLQLDAARFDKLELVREYRLDNIPRDYDSALELAQIIGDDGHSLSVANSPLDERCGAFVVYRTGRGNGGIKLNVGRTVGRHRWLVSLDVEFREVNRRGNIDDSEAARPDINVKVLLVLNPTRVSAHSLRRAVVPSTADWRDVLTSDIQTYELVKAESVNMLHDNLLPASAYQNPASIEQTTAEVQAFVNAVDALLMHFVDASDAGARGRPAARLSPHRLYWTVRQAEVYWEFGHTNAIQFVRGLRSSIWSICSDMQERVWSLDDDSEVISYSMRLTASNRLALYVKGVDRVRLEVRYNRKPPGSTQPTLVGRLREIARDAAVRADDSRRAILQRLANRPSSLETGPNPELLCQLVSLLATAYAARPERIEGVLRSLLTRGGVRTGDGFSVTTSEAQALERFRIVDHARVGSPSANGNLYPLVVRFQQLFELFGES